MFEQDSLTPAEQELELALRSLRPAPARIDLTAALAAGPRTAARRKQLWTMAVAATALVAAGSAWLALRWDPSPTNLAAPKDNVVAVPWQNEPPTLLVYRQALAQSPEALNELLDRQAIAGHAFNREVTPVSMASLWNAELYSQVGEM
jgi:hypothetical protein